ncbi:YdcF family protein [Nocardia yunnanensis]|uniref:YdcF family protein n=1 Tax=Nocardia yunnanensis TaxID=2382165 RepID=A0A386ZKK5_9NOCA|nr:YdcF family protein [Nocardia yunnanensis]AYF78111.1 YdcF family protein [Nocardia yunnanensis]
METAALLSLGSVLAAVGVFRVTREPRRLSTGLVVLAAVVLLAAGCATLAVGFGPIATARSHLAAIAAAVLAAGGIALVANGFTVVRREGRSPTTFVPMVAGTGLLVLATGIAVMAAGVPAPSWATQLGLLGCLVGGYLVMHLIAFTGYALLYSNLPDRSEADAIVILGCGLNRRAVTPLLAARLDRGIRAYRAAAAVGAPPVIVTCGGQGPDEATCEADAMARYLTAHDIPANMIVRERHSQNTAENIGNCVRQLEIRGIPAHRIRMTVVTSNFHVLRSAALTRRAGIDAHVVGARTAGYFIPAAFLREFVAVLLTHYRRTHLLAAAVTLAGVTAVVADAALPPH